MGALDDLIAQDQGGGSSRLDDLIAQDAAQNARGGNTTGGEADPAIPPQPDFESHWYDDLLAPISGALPGGALSHAANNPGLNAGVQGFAHGMTAGADQNIPAYGDFVRGERQDAQQAAPGPYRAGDALGSLMSPANLTGGVARQMGGAAIQGATRSFSDANPDRSVGDRAGEAGLAGLASAGVAGAVSGGAKLVGAGASAISSGARSVADRARNMGWGTPKDALEEFASQRGLAPNDALRTFVGEGEKIAPPNAITPRSPGSYQPQFAAGQQDAGQRIGQSIADAQAEGVASMDPNARSTLLRRFDTERDAAMTSGVNREAYANALGKESEAVMRGPGFSTPQDLRQAKTAFGQNAYGSDPSIGEAASAQAADFGRSTVRDQLNDYMGQASPEIGQAFNQANRDYGVSSTLANATGARANAINTGAGGGIGTGLVGQLGKMIPGGSLIPDAAANAGRAVQGATGAVGDAATGFGDNAPIGAMAGQQMGDKSAALRDWFQQKGVRIEDVPQQSRGNLLGNAAQQLLQTDPQSLGQWQQEIADAAGKGQEALNAVIVKLETDPQFRTGPMLKMQALTGEH